MNKHPTVSVIMPAYNSSLYIAMAIESILNQTYTDFELIIIDDASTDDTWHIISGFAHKDSRIKAFQNYSNLQLTKTLNIGIKKANGAYIARMDPDDIALPTRLETQVTYLDTNHDIGLLGGYMYMIDSQGNDIGIRRYQLTDTAIRRNIFLYSPFSHPTVMIRSECLRLAGLYNDKYKPADDYELYFRVGTKTKFANLDKFLIKYRVSSKSLTATRQKLIELQTLRIRVKYFRKYKATLLDMIYTLLQFISLYIVPMKIRNTAFTRLRALI